ncbi:MAG TPA: autotransporter-associated beta strand repeat-containing protein [Pseudomonadales bacterium]|nr:autotransporter-associated beta strand repeat-containing protein [Pseudomonadales bacterium]
MKTSPKSLSVFSIVSAALLLGGISVHAASQVWTNAPVDNTWSNNNNWVSLAVPGSVNATANTGNNVNNDAATYNSPIPASGYGGATKPILTTDSTNATRSLEIGSIFFDTANCGAYFFQTNTPCNYTFTTTNSFGSNGCLYVCMLNAASPTNGIFMTPTVNSSQTFLVPVFIRLPSSTAGIYNFVNNSANPAATLYFNAITNDSSATRGTVYTLGGSNTGTNTIENLSKGTTTTGAMGFTKQGTGTWILPNASDFPKQAVINLNDGILQVLNSGCWNAATPVIVNSNAVEQLVNASQTNTTINGNGTVQEVNGAGFVTSLAVGASVGVTPHLKTTSSSDVIFLGTNIATAVTGGSATSVIHINGPGTVEVLTNSTYNGNWSADSGILQVGATTALGTGPNVNVAAGGILDLTPLGAGVTFNPSTAGVGGSGTGTTVGSTAATIKPDAAGTLDLATGAKNISLTYAPTSFTGDTTHPALYVSQGTLALGGNTFTVNNTSGTPLGAGTYTLIQVASGNITSSGNLAANVTGSGVASGNTGTIQVSGGQVNLVVAVYVPNHLVWQGGNPNNNWDVNTTPNWLNGGVASVFNNSDFVTFDATGAAHPNINLVGALIPNNAPGSIIVDTTAANYTFGGSGAIGGTANLTKMGTGTLVISNLNSYLGSTVISNGTIQVGINNALSGNSDVTINNGAAVDLNSWSTAIGALNGSGTVDTVLGGTPVLTIGNNADSGTFSGVIKNTAGSLGVVKANTGTEVLSGANSYAGGTTVNAGVLRVTSSTGLGTGGVTNNSGTVLDISTNVTVASLAGVGTVENNSTTTTNQIIVTGSSTITGAILDGSGGGGISVLVRSGILLFNAVSTYSGGTIVSSGATLQINDEAGGTEAGTGGIIASNFASIGMPGASSSSAVFGNTITTVNNAQVTFTSGETANEYTGLFVGGITSTDIFAGGNMTIGGNGDNYQLFTNFLGTVIVTNGTVRSFGNPSGGERTAFDFIGLGIWNARDGGTTVHFGSLSGDPTANILGPTGGGSNPNTPDTYIIGEANANSVYSGSISGTNNLVKTGTGTLTLNGGGFLYTNIFTEGFETITNIGYGSNQMFFVGTTTVSNGVLALVAPTYLTNSTTITLAGASAVLDATSMGFISNEFDSDGFTLTNSFPVTNSIFELVAVIPATGTPQTLGGVGTLNGILLADQGTFLAPGLPTGVFSVSSNATLSGAVTMDLDSTNAAQSSELDAKSFAINGTSTLVVTNIGPGIIQGATFKLFNHPVSGFGSVTLPAKDPTGTTNYIWQNYLAVDGTITLTNGGVTPPPANPPPISFTVSGSTLTLSWPLTYLGYTLQVQTNSLAVGLSTNWVNVAGSTSMTSTNITVNAQNAAVFYRLHN